MKRISGSLQLKNGTYYVVYRIDDKQKWENTHIHVGKSKRETKRNRDTAIVFMTEFLDNLNQGLAQQEAEMKALEKTKQSVPFIAFLDCWLEEIKPQIKPATWEAYDKTVSGKIKPYFDPLKLTLSELRGGHFSKFFVYLKESGRADGNGGLGIKSISNIKGVLSSALGYAVENELIETNPILKSRMPYFDDNISKQTGTISAHGISKLMNYLEETGSDMLLFFSLVTDTGCRKGEILGLCWDAVDFKENTIKIFRNRTGSRSELQHTATSPKTRNSIRTLSLSEKTMSLLKKERINQLENRKIFKEQYVEYPEDYVIRFGDGRVWQTSRPNRRLKKVREDLGLPYFRIHDIRHCVATVLFDNDVPLRDITAQLGHGQTSTTERIYVHKNNVASQRNLSLLNTAFCNNC